MMRYMWNPRASLEILGSLELGPALHRTASKFYFKLNVLKIKLVPKGIGRLIGISRHKMGFSPIKIASDILCYLWRSPQDINILVSKLQVCLWRSSDDLISSTSTPSVERQLSDPFHIPTSPLFLQSKLLKLISNMTDVWWPWNQLRSEVLVLT